MATVDPPTEIIRVGYPYTYPASWHRGSPCTCNDCPVCDTYVPVRQPLLLTVADEGKCYSGDVPVVMPDVSTVETGWCIGLKNDEQGEGPMSCTTYESYDGGGVYFFIDGEQYTVVMGTRRGSEFCICFDGKNWVATGDVSGMGFPPGP